MQVIWCPGFLVLVVRLEPPYALTFNGLPRVLAERANKPLSVDHRLSLLSTVRLFLYSLELVYDIAYYTQLDKNI
jgi:hypothetical protein